MGKQLACAASRALTYISPEARIVRRETSESTSSAGGTIKLRAARAAAPSSVGVAAICPDASSVCSKASAVSASTDASIRPSASISAASKPTAASAATVAFHAHTRPARPSLPVPAGSATYDSSGATSSAARVSSSTPPANE